MKSAYPIKKVGQIYECMDGTLLEVTYAWNDGSAMMKNITGPRSGLEDCVGGWNIFKLVNDIIEHAA
ncbi:hypothetical protein WG886_004361 [Yersinia enterocolitica]